MPFIEAPTTFYMGRRYDSDAKRLTDDVVYYDSRDLTTHAVVVGMTGSGKTGMCIALLEEAVLDNIPAICIDPKGDITNLLLAFPELRPSDFAPWINVDDARRAGLDLNEYSKDVAQQWRDGLASWSIVPGRIAAMKNAAQFSIYTPGSDAGLPISILDSLHAPREGWAGNEESHRERISGIVTALLALVGKQVTPVKDREHVLISNIFETAWKSGRDLTLEDIILQVQKPPFAKLGVFDVNTFFPEKDRFKLATDLNHIIAAPSFQAWITGEPLEISHLLYTPEGKARVSIFYLAHLTEDERSFIITLLLESMLAWMRTLSGTTSLRSLLYFDEVFGHFPPAPHNPPTKEPLLRLLKQARAFGIGLILATQNPGDLDYKGLSNAGTWFIGKLQTENDKKRVLGGLQSAATADSHLDMDKMNALLSGLAPRVFVVHNVHDQGGPTLLHTRWTMSYLSGPLTRQQIRILMDPQVRAFMGRPPAPVAQANLQAGQYAQPAAVPVTPPQSTPASAWTPKPAVGAPQKAKPTTPSIFPVGVDARLRAEAQGSLTQTPVPPHLPEAPGASMAQPSNVPPPHLPEVPNVVSPAAASSPIPDFPPVPGNAQPNAPVGVAVGQATVPDPAANAPADPVADQQYYRYTPPTQGATVAASAFSYNETTSPPNSPAPSTPPANASTQAQSNLPVGFHDRPPALPSSVAQFFLPTLITVQQAVRDWEQGNGTTAGSIGPSQLAYRPVLIAQVLARYLDRKTGAQDDQRWSFHVPRVEQAGLIRWTDYQANPVDPAQVTHEPFGDALYGELSGGLTDSKRMTALKSEVVDYVYRSAALTIFYNSTLDVYGKPRETRRDYLLRTQQLAREQRDAEIDKQTQKVDADIAKLDDQLRRQLQSMDFDQRELKELKREDLYTTGEAVFGLLRGRPGYTLSRMSRTKLYKTRAQGRVVAGQDEVNALEKQMESKQEELKQSLQAINDKWAKIATAVEDVKITPFKKDIGLEIFGIGWIPVYYVTLNGQGVFLSAFATAAPKA